MTRCSSHLQPTCSPFHFHFRIPRAVVLPIDLGIWWTCSTRFSVLRVWMSQFCRAGAFLLICTAQGLSILGYPGLVDLDPVYCMPASIIEAKGLRKAWKALERRQSQVWEHQVRGPRPELSRNLRWFFFCFSSHEECQLMFERHHSI